MTARGCAIAALTAAALLLSACGADEQPGWSPTGAGTKAGTAVPTPTTGAPGATASSTWLAPSTRKPGIDGIPTTYPADTRRPPAADAPSTKKPGGTGAKTRVPADVK